MTVTDPFPLTDLQAAYLVGMSPLIELGGFRPTMYWELDVVGVDPARAEQAAARIVARHDHLRTVALPDGRQRVLDADEVPAFRIPMHDVAGLDRAAQEEAIAATRERMCQAGVDPTSWPLFDIRFTLVRRHRMRVHIAMSLLLLDARSTRQLLEEWRAVYTEPGRELPPVRTTHRDARLAMLEYEQSEEYQEHWAYWRDRLDTLAPAPVLPRTPDSPSGPVHHTRRTCRLSAEQWARLRATVRGQKVLPATALLQALAETLGAWAAEPRFCLNVLHHGAVAGRPQWQDVVGQLSSTLPVEFDLAASPDFWERARLLQRRMWQDMAHGDVTAIRVTRELAARRGWNSQAVLPYVFNSMLGEVTRAGTGIRPTCRLAYSHLRTPQVLLDNQVQEAPDGGVLCVWDTVDEAFPPGLVETMFEAYHRLLTRIAAPGAAEARLDAVPPAHRALVDRLNPFVRMTSRSVPRGRLEDGFLRNAAARPEAVAIVTNQRSLTYGELQERSRAVAGWLREHGAGPGTLVPVVMSKGWEQIVAVLGVLRAGAAYCPVDANLPPERIRHLIEECGAPVYLSQSWHAAAATITGARAQVMDVDRPPITAARDLDLIPMVPGDTGETGDSADPLAYVIHTSGSTGRPKGVMIGHRAALNTIADVNERIALSSEDRVFGISSLSFDLSVWDVFGTLAAGAALVLPPASARPDPPMWAATAAAHGVTVWNSVPMLAELLVETLEQTPSGSRPADAAPPMRSFLLSGDWIPIALPDRLRAMWPAVRVLALGGATEASIWSNFYEVGEVDPAWRSIPYGRPLRAQTMRILDHALEVRPPWAAGRIYIGGVGVAQGYLNDAERTAERFVRHPRTGERLYWTGDLGRYWPDGTIEFLGREDRQLKIQGFRVEPGEVEAVIRTHPAVRDCAVGAETGPSGHPRLAALVVPHPAGWTGGDGADGADGADGTASAGSAGNADSVAGADTMAGADSVAAADDGTAVGQVTAGDIAAFLRDRLPGYLVPARLHLVDRLALSANGKVDVAGTLALLPPPDDPAGPDAPAASDAVVARLAELWAEILELPGAGPDTDFFAAGGNSLLALRLVHRIRERFGADIPFGQLFEAPTVAALARRLRVGAAGSCAVELRGGQGEELFLFHPVGGSVSCYTDFADSWPGPVVAFQSAALASGTAPTGRTLPEMAAAYREQLVARSPDGPYLLGGWSMGGVLAFEVARQLAAEGRPARIFMIDSDVTTVRPPAPGAGRHLEFLRDVAGGSLPEQVARAIHEAAAQSADGDDEPVARAALEAAVAAGVLPRELDMRQYERLAGTHAANLAALAAYRPEPCPGLSGLLFVAGTVPRDDPLPAWNLLIPELAAEVWLDDHYSLVRPDRLALISRRVQAWSGISPQR